MTKEQSNTKWNGKLEKVLKVIEKQCENYKNTHQNISIDCEKKYSLLMLSSIILAPLSGIVSTIGATADRDINTMFYYTTVSTVLSFATGIIVSVIKFSKFDKSSNAHTLAASRYISLGNNIKRQLLLDYSDRVPAKEYLDWVIKNFDDLYTSSPIVSDDILNKYSKFRDLYNSETDSEKSSKSISDTSDSNSVYKSSSGDESYDLESAKILTIVNIKDDNSYNKCFNCKQDVNDCNDPINKINLSKIKENKNTKTHIFTSHQDLQKYDDNTMKLELNYDIDKIF
jgi:hypothetical protein